jgi:hypothetical protein
MRIFHPRADLLAVCALLVFSSCEGCLMGLSVKDVFIDF